MSDEMNDCEQSLHFALQFNECSREWELDTLDVNPVRYYEQKDQGREERLGRWLDFMDR